LGDMVPSDARYCFVRLSDIAPCLHPVLRPAYEAFVSARPCPSRLLKDQAARERLLTSQPLYAAKPEGQKPNRPKGELHVFSGFLTLSMIAALPDTELADLTVPILFFRDISDAEIKDYAWASIVASKALGDPNQNTGYGLPNWTGLLETDGYGLEESAEPNIRPRTTLLERIILATEI